MEEFVRNLFVNKSLQDAFVANPRMVIAGYGLAPAERSAVEKLGDRLVEAVKNRIPGVAAMDTLQWE